MKICPQCNTTYDDDTLNFCLEDGTVLTQPSNTSSIEDPPPTVMMGQAQETFPNQNITEQPTQPTWDNTPKYQAPSSGSSGKTWLWALGIIFVVVMLCGGGFVGLVLLVPDEDDDFVPNTNITTTNKKNDNRKPTKDNRTLVESINFSKWDIKENDYISAEYVDGELRLTSKDRYYYIILTKGFKTYNATTRLTLRNPENERASLGYGLVVHSHPKNVLSKDYAFLIRTDTKQYRVVRHTNKRESNIIKWTRSSAIKGGTQSNDLEVRVNGNEMSFYINNEFVTTVKDFTGYKDGVAGVYTSDDVPIAFQKLELRK